MNGKIVSIQRRGNYRCSKANVFVLPKIPSKHSFWCVILFLSAITFWKLWYIMLFEFVILYVIKSYRILNFSFCFYFISWMNSSPKSCSKSLFVQKRISLLQLQPLYSLLYNVYLFVTSVMFFLYNILFISSVTLIDFW